MIPHPADITLNPFRAMAFGAVVVCALLLLQYAHRRKPFILAWAAGWLLIAPSRLLVGTHYTNAAVGRGAVGLAQLLGVCTSLLFFWSADLYRQSGFVNAHRLKTFGGPVAAWFVLAPLIFGMATVVAPGYAVEAALFAAAGASYFAVLLERRMIGAGLVAFVLFGLAISRVTSAYFDAGAPAGEYTFEILIVNTVLYAFGAVGIHLLVFEDMTVDLRITNRHLEDARSELIQAAVTDPLTGCHNRRFLDEVMDRELKRHERFHLPLSLLFVDVNRFKSINDTLGHEAGDRVLQHVAHFLKRRIREADYVFRWGGDEFLALLTCTGEEARLKASALKAAFEADPGMIDLPPGVGLSVGSIEVPPGTMDLMPLVNEADRLMYRDKRPTDEEMRAFSLGPAPRKKRRDTRTLRPKRPD